MEKDMIKLTPNLGVGFVFQILKFFGIILIIILSILYVNFLAGFNVPEFLWEIMKDSFSIVSEAFGGVGLNAYELSIYIVEDVLTHIWVQIVAVLFLVVVSVL
ncbi:hypothetical protein HQ529_02130, partial [Candidatus Woesearchaeota archaeon]|nr:hypothetical protein [Candidatus Woesearchaeota archaeon]